MSAEEKANQFFSDSKITLEKNSDGNVICPIRGCKKTYKSEKTLFSHMKKDHPEWLNDKNYENSVRKDKQIEALREEYESQIEALREEHESQIEALREELGDKDKQMLAFREEYESEDEDEYMEIVEWVFDGTKYLVDEKTNAVSPFVTSP